MRFGVEALVFVDAAEDVGDERLEKQPRSNPDVAAELAGDGGGQWEDERIVNPLAHSVRMVRLEGEEIPDV